MTRAARVFAVVLLVAVMALGAVLLARRGREQESGRDVLVVYAPCGMTGPFNNVLRLFRDSHPEIRLDVLYDNGVVLIRNIRKGGRPDVLLSPGELEMRQMVEEGYVDPESVRDFATLEMVVIAPKSLAGVTGLADLTGPRVKRISMADPKLNSVGYYGERALRSLGLWEPLQSKLLLREYSLEAVTLVTTGVVDAGITYLTCPLDTAPEKADKSDVRVLARLPREAYAPVRLQVGVLREAKRSDLGRMFIEFMLSEQAQQAVATDGLLPAEAIE